jgi:hypothetical protein
MERAFAAQQERMAAQHLALLGNFAVLYAMLSSLRDAALTATALGFNGSTKESLETLLTGMEGVLDKGSYNWRIAQSMSSSDFLELSGMYRQIYGTGI